MDLSPREKDKLMIFVAAMWDNLSRKRVACKILIRCNI